MQPTEREGLDRLNAALNAIDSATTQAGAAVTAVQNRITDLMNQIAASNNVEEIHALATRATTSAEALTPIATALTAMGTNPTDPVPVPVPNPEV